MLDMLPKHPTFKYVKTADAIIRATRSEAYFATWDHLTAQWCESFGIEPSMSRLLGANLGVGNDFLFEHTPSAQATQVFEAIQEMTGIEHAAQQLERKPADLLDAVKTHVALITFKGFDLLSGNGLAEDWLAAWQDTLRNQNQAQVDYVRTTAQPEQRVGIVLDIDEAFDAYLERFALTDAITASVIAAFPFSSLSSNRAPLDALLALVGKYARYIRLVADYPFDETEPLNLPVFVTAASRDISSGEARQLLINDPDLQVSINDLILERASEYLEILVEANQVQCKNLSSEQSEALTGLLDTVLGMCRRHIESQTVAR
jgi:hypothetical protein